MATETRKMWKNIWINLLIFIIWIPVKAALPDFDLAIGFLINVISKWYIKWYVVQIIDIFKNI